jgi:hypothetical protein
MRNLIFEEEELEGASYATRQAAMDKLVPGLEPAEYGQHARFISR